MYNEEQRVRATNIIFELIQLGIGRNAYSSVEIGAIRESLHVLQTVYPEPAPQVEELIDVKERGEDIHKE